MDDAETRKAVTLIRKMVTETREAEIAAAGGPSGGESAEDKPWWWSMVG